VDQLTELLRPSPAAGSPKLTCISGGVRSICTAARDAQPLEQFRLNEPIARKTRYSRPVATSYGPDISPAKPTKLSPDAWQASRLVRLETGSTSEAVFDRWAVA